MGLLTISKKVYLAGGHHRQPRNTSSTVQVGPTETYTNTTSVDRTADPQIFFDLDGQQTVANFLFWSTTDGSSGDTQTAPHLNHSVSPSGLIVTAWYFPQGGGPGTGTAIIDDAFSALKSDFIDDTFVTVTSDPSLTSQANVVGVVPTAEAETLKATPSVPSTGEPFKQWMSFSAGTASGDTLSVPAGADGLAFAVYESAGSVKLPGVPNYGIYGTLVGGVAVDGGGGIIINGHWHPVDPWGPLTVQLVQASLVSAGSRAASAKVGAAIQKLAAVQALESIKAVLPAIQRAAEGARE